MARDEFSPNAPSWSVGAAEDAAMDAMTQSVAQHNAKTSYFYTPHDGEGRESRRSPRPRDLVCEQSDEFIGLLGAIGSIRA